MDILGAAQDSGDCPLIRSSLKGVSGEPYRKRRKLSHSIEELVATLSDECEGADSVEGIEVRRRRRKRNGSHRTEFNRIRHFSYSSLDPAGPATFSIGDKANLFTDEDHEDRAMPMIIIDNLLDRIFMEIEKEYGKNIFVVLLTL